jgi:hypothetical protein
LSRSQGAARRPQELLSHKPPRHEKNADTDRDAEQRSEHRSTAHPADSQPLLVILTGQILDRYSRSRIASGTALPELHAGLFAIEKLDASGFKGVLHGMNSSGRHGSPASLEASHDRSPNPRSFCKLYLCPIKQPSGGSALRRSHFRLPFGFGGLSRTPWPSVSNSMPAFSSATGILPMLFSREFIPPSNRLTVFSPTSASSASFRVDQPKAARAILHWFAFAKLDEDPTAARHKNQHACRADKRVDLKQLD